MKLVIALIGIMLSTAAVAVATHDDKTPDKAPSTQPVNKFCAVEHDEEANPKVTYEYQGKVYAFCCKDCIPKFKAEPAKYLEGIK